MSTFDGIVQEFPYIQIDYFRKNPDRPPPLACFLSHVHSDHLQGLESFRAPFIYCSAATRELLLRIEKYPHRMNFDKGILESRRLHYKHLYKLLRPIPLNTPTEIELTPRLSIRVTLFDANHCTSAVMFLVEGDGKAILYTGDIRAESWWVNSLVRNPILIPYTLGAKRLDKIYLDTTFARAENLQQHFPSKAEGLAELLQKVNPYPEDTTFYFRAWTFGYEEVWMALSTALNAKIHVDRYQLGLYRSVSLARGGNEVSALCGFELGNRSVPGCLTDDENSRIHSCVCDLPCSVARSEKTVYIEPIVGRLQDGSQLPDVGIGGGAGDLYQVHELELPDQASLEELEKLCLERIHDSQVLSQTRDALFEAFRSKSKSLSLDSYGIKDDTDIPLEKLVSILSRGHAGDQRSSADVKDKAGNQLPNIIQFPYSRHSSYNELCELISALKPKDVYPCTTDPLTWDETSSIQALFGHLCSGDHFSHDTHMRETIANDEDLLHSRKRAHYDEGSSPQASQQSSFADSDFNLSNSFASTQRHVKRPKPSTFPAKYVTKDFSSSSSSGRLLPSSMEMIHETHVNTNANSNEPLTVPEPTPETERAKRNEIRRTWLYLRSNLPNTSHLGPLPSSWPIEEDDGLRNEDRNVNDNNNSINTETRLPPSTAPSPFPSPSPPSHNPNPDIMELDTNTTHQTESQQTNSPSIPESAFASFSSQDPEQEDGPEIASTLRRRSRKAAYVAAQADTYEAWSFVSLVSAGNNHTEPEIEL
ncbi:putative DNA repair protein [Aspergillus glaucus CBS 516.65]|uniref:Protein artemis n=1 Tax=Aspergillus glaucus CBS 516.65 TaxID=1160497 RepID=A0A1L9VRH9_ASPGL|nr:hypothetical protein ASPGLDRAFT_80506 [Aspergillus glaucus CBS 516.65]OJJ86535.1 hypothetical protein ASPGLDRAFT_80506 [Aspergillus glaucus CBS 516.65]